MLLLVFNLSTFFFTAYYKDFVGNMFLSFNASPQGRSSGISTLMLKSGIELLETGDLSSIAYILLNCLLKCDYKISKDNV